MAMKNIGQILGSSAEAHAAMFMAHIKARYSCSRNEGIHIRSIASVYRKFLESIEITPESDDFSVSDAFVEAALRTMGVPIFENEPKTAGLINRIPAEPAPPPAPEGTAEERVAMFAKTHVSRFGSKFIANAHDKEYGREDLLSAGRTLRMYEKYLEIAANLCRINRGRRFCPSVVRFTAETFPESVAEKVSPIVDMAWVMPIPKPSKKFIREALGDASPYGRECYLASAEIWKKDGWVLQPRKGASPRRWVRDNERIEF